MKQRGCLNNFCYWLFSVNLLGLFAYLHRLCFLNLIEATYFLVLQNQKDIAERRTNINVGCNLLFKSKELKNGLLTNYPKHYNLPTFQGYNNSSRLFNFVV